MRSKADAAFPAPSHRIRRRAGCGASPRWSTTSRRCATSRTSSCAAADWFKALGRGKDAGTKIYGASGKLRRPGAWELPMGTPIREILDEHAGGMRPGCRIPRRAPGGGSTDFLVAEHLDLAMDFDTIAAAGSRLGTGTMIVLDDRTCPVAMVRNLEHFFAQESCGWCTPCRDGLPWIASVLDDIESGRGAEDDLDLLALAGAAAGAGAHVLRACPWRRRTAAERAQALPRRFRAAHPRAPLSLELTHGRSAHYRRPRISRAPGPQPARGLPVAGPRPALFLLASGAGLRRRLPPVRGQGSTRTRTMGRATS